MKAFATRIEISAPAAAVWKILVDLPRWPEWNGTIDRTQGQAEPGARVTVFVKQNPGRAFPVRVTEFAAPRRMVWSGGMPFGLFVGTRVYELAEAGASTTIFGMREAYTGPLAGLIGRSIPDLQPAFDEFAACLKRAAENAGTRPLRD